MKRLYSAWILVILLLSCSRETNFDYPISPVTFTQVKLTDQFWGPRIETNRLVTIPSAFRKCEETGRVANFDIAAGRQQGEFQSQFPFDDSDVYKIIEGASYSLSTHYDAELDHYVDTLIEKIAAAQEDDGYIMTWRTINPQKPPTSWSGTAERWSDIGGGHELYNAGHMYEAAVAHWMATGKRTFLNVAIKNADLIAGVFGPGKLMMPPGHEEVEIGLIKLYRATNDKKYFDLAKFFIDQRGNRAGHQLYGEYSQDHLPIFEQNAAVGHAVRAGYFYSGVADIAALSGQEAYIQAIDRIWENVVTKKLYITGGIGARGEGEAFGDDYELPNATAYNETCAAIANVLWNYRMFLLKGNAKYLDVLERTLYNGLLAGVSLSGDTYFYPNCLAFDGHTPFNQGSTSRKAWFGCSCCPSNISRFIPSLPGYFYAQRHDTLYVNLYAASTCSLKIKEKSLQLIQETFYPWEGDVRIRLKMSSTLDIVIKLRIPGWAYNQPVPGDLYRYIKNSETAITCSVNQQPVELLTTRGNVTIARRWKDGDIISLHLPMEIKQVQANEQVMEDRGKISLERGPIVYCLEAIDNQNSVSNLWFNADHPLMSEYKADLLSGLTIIKGEAFKNRITPQEIVAVPYYAWNHRGSGEMAVWLAVHDGLEE